MSVAGGPGLPRGFFTRPADLVARDLLGCVLTHTSAEGRAGGRIVETEAYLPEGDPASHAHRGPTPRNASMFLVGGHAYVYLVYGLHLCFNVVTGPAGSGQAVLIRALEPVAGMELMAERRGRPELCNGPARLVQALGIERIQDGADLLDGPLTVCTGQPLPASTSIACGPRIGINRAVELPLRFYLEGNPCISRRTIPRATPRR
ncbi:MAG: 3-methyladenine DNA glycosylase [Planctomycetes bacterium]|jgi:DNA-3-methyladenine glycosylase|nr:3-methyladenine DNA glycosylase [Planctomycetota bacterium]HJO27286.1 DNA-3-methyladenine glycosylase [Planctomycetota bacterium]